MAASGSGGMKGGIRRLKARALALNVTTPARTFGRVVLWLGLTLATNSLALADIGRPGRDEGPTKVEGGTHFNENNEVRFTCHDVRFTVKDDDLFAICLGRPGDRVTLESFKDSKFIYEEDIRDITMLGVPGSLKWFLNADGLNIEVPRTVPSNIAVAFKIRTGPAV